MPTGTLNSHHNLRDCASPQKLNLFTLLWYIIFLPSLGYPVCPVHVIYPLRKPFMTLQLTSKHLTLANTWYPPGFSHSHNHSAWGSTYICWFTNVALYWTPKYAQMVGFTSGQVKRRGKIKMISSIQPKFLLSHFQHKIRPFFPWIVQGQ